MNNLPNKLTILRMLMVPAVMFFMLTESISHPSADIIAAAIFIIASVTDWFDGRIARKYNLITNFGKVMDPLADKLIVFAVILCLVKQSVFPVWCAMIILARDFLVTGMRVIAVSEGISVAASIWGKVKTTVQMIMCCLLIARLPFNFMRYVEQVFIYAALVLTVYSLIVYLVQNKDVLKDN